MAIERTMSERERNVGRDIDYFVSLDVGYLCYCEGDHLLGNLFENKGVGVC